jgi:hypothetical protein
MALMESPFRDPRRDHALMGHWSGGYFTGYALLARPGDLSRYIIGSGTSGVTLELEERCAGPNTGLPARVFVGAGSDELDLAMSADRIVSRTTVPVENSRMRQYASLARKSQLYADREHFNVIPPAMTSWLKRNAKRGGLRSSPWPCTRAPGSRCSRGPSAPAAEADSYSACRFRSFTLRWRRSPRKPWERATSWSL